MDWKNEIIKTIQSMSGKYSAYEIFTDWIRCMALSISNSMSMIQDKIWQEREDMYADTMKKYEDQERMKLFEMFSKLIKALEEGPDDVLGDIYMKSGMGSKTAGQFFTPFHLSVLTAKCAVDISKIKSNDDKIEINEPSCGGGGMIIAVAKVLHEEKIDWQKRMKVVAQDLDWKGVYMCYVQLSLLGINAVCVQGDTLKEPYVHGKTSRRHILVTPAAMGVLL